MVTIHLPDDGMRHEVTLQVHDAYGERDFTFGVVESGETLERTITVYGPARLLTYLDGHLAEERDLE